MRASLSLTCCLFVVALGSASAPSSLLAAAHAEQKRPAQAAEPGAGVRAAALARTLLGVPYRSGGSSPETGFDCSGLVQYVYGELGIELPHSSWAQARLGRAVGSTSTLTPGDIVYFAGASHVGIYIGNGLFVHAPHSGALVRIDPVGWSWYRSTFDGARRVA